MERLITDEPNNNMSYLHNLVFIKNKEVYLRGVGESGEDMNLYDYARREIKAYAEYDDDNLAEIMLDEIDSPVRLAYWLAVGFAEVRERLKECEQAEAGGGVGEIAV